MPDYMTDDQLDALLSELVFAEDIHRGNTGATGKYGQAALAIAELREQRDALQVRLRECERSFLAADAEMARTGHVRSYWVEYQARIAGQEVTD